jgi:glycosyltransferase involved in cell wall biosynthesis
LPFFDIPFIYGPLGGGEGIPESFIKGLSFSQRLIQRARGLLKLSVGINPIILHAASKSVSILCRTNDTASLFPQRYRNRIRILEDGAIEQDIFAFHASHKARDVVRIISTSRFIGFKNVISLVQAFQYIPSKYKVECVIIGDGPERNKIQEAAKLVPHPIIFKKGLTRNEVLSELQDSDIFVSPSLRDACNLSLLEAMAVGLPIVCLNWSGMAISTDDSCAVRLPVTNPEQMPKDLANALIDLTENPEKREVMGNSARKRIKEVFNWEAKGEFMEQLFNDLDKR